MSIILKKKESTSMWITSTENRLDIVTRFRCSMCLDFFLSFIKIVYIYFMEAIVYTFLLITTLGIIFFAIFFREPPRIAKLFIYRFNYEKVFFFFSSVCVVFFDKRHDLFDLCRFRSSFSWTSRSF